MKLVDNGRRLWQRRRRRWIDGRHPSQPKNCVGMRSIYILPSRMGLVFLLFMLFIFLLAANYQNALIFALFFWLVALAVLNLHYTHNNLLGLSLSCVAVRHGFAGETVAFDIEISRRGKRGRFALMLGGEETALEHRVDLAEAATQTVTVAVPAQRRGYVTCPQLTLYTLYPLGIARAWSYVRLSAYALAYPSPVDAGIVRESATVLEGVEHSQVSTGVSDFEELRSYVPGDRLSRVHWAASSRSSILQVKHFVDPVAQDEWLRWEDYGVLPTEARLQHLMYLVQQTEQQHQAYGLELPDFQLKPAQGAAHFQACCEALARYGLKAPT